MQPNRIYYLEDPKSEAPKWCKEIKRVWMHYYDNPTSWMTRTYIPAVK